MSRSSRSVSIASRRTDHSTSRDRDMKLRITLSVSLAAVALIAVPASAAPKTDLKVGMAAQDVGQLDPHRAVSTIDRTVVAWMYSGLVRFKPGTMDPAQIEPDLAEKWESSA